MIFKYLEAHFIVKGVQLRRDLDPQKLPKTNYSQLFEG